MSPATVTCASCGAKASGRFCSNCGASLTPGACVRCGAPRDAAARFCPNCGAPSSEAPRPAGGISAAWVVAGLAGVIAAAALVWAIRSGGPVGAPAASPTASSGPPDLSQMTPQERFDRLFNRIMTAAENGDTTQVAQFLPMAKAAYLQLPSVNADARYHMAMLEIQAGNGAAALAQADSIVAGAPRHLFVFLIREAAAMQRGDTAAARAARRDLRAAWDAEIALERPEYAEHRAGLERIRGERP